MKKLWFVIAVGIILRIILSLITFHPDMQVFDMAGQLVASGNILNLYDFSSSSGVLNYPPLIYLLHGLFRFLSGGLEGLLILKLPYLIFDLLTGFILFKLFDDRKKAALAFTLWMFNPVSLYATYMMGQFDIIPAFFIALSIYQVIKGKLEWAALALGFGIAFKISPIFLVIPLIILGKNIGERLKLLMLALAPYLISVLPFIFSSSFRSTALFANQSSKSLYANIPVSGGESIILFPTFLLFYYLFIWFNRIKGDIVKLYFIPLLLFFIFTHFHPQWLIWIAPLVILDLVSSPKNYPVYLLIFISWLASLFFFDPSLTLGIFAPLFPTTASLWSLLKFNPDFNLSRSIIQTIFAASAFYLIYQFFPKKVND